MKLHVGKEKWNQAAAFFIRMQVFVLERGIPLKEEFDADDHDQTLYTVVYDGEQPIATGRYKQIDAETVRPGRIAVLKECRGRGLGRIIVEEIERQARQRGCTVSVIHSELTAMGFYESMGYVRDSEVYEEDGVPCVTLKKSIKTTHAQSK